MKILRLCFFFFFFFLLFDLLQSQYVQRTKMTVADDYSADSFGYSVSINGNTLVVGTTLENSKKGAAYVYIQNGANWVFQQKLTASDALVDDRFGWSVSISGDYLVVGAILVDIAGRLDQGAAYVFMRNGTTWTQQQKLTASDGAATDIFGQSVSISGDYLVVGANLVDIAGRADQGAAYVFLRSGTTWTQQQKLTASDGAALDYFGNSVSISGDYIVIGASGADISVNANQGAAYVFIRSGTTWNQQQKLNASDGLTNNYFGITVSISGDYFVVGANVANVSGRAYQGAAYVFMRNGVTWNQQQKLTAVDGVTGDQFGQSVAISGDYLVVGAIFADISVNINQGAAYVFMRSGTTWNQQQKLTASNGLAGDYFGNAVSISGISVVVGAPNQNSPNIYSQGLAHVFSAPFLSSTYLASSSKAGSGQQNLGYAVSVSGNTCIAGAPFAYVMGHSRSGGAYIFDSTQSTPSSRIVGSDSLSDDRFGWSVSISGDYLVVGAYLANVSGAAYVFMRNGNTWTQQQKLTVVGASNDRFGFSVSISGDYIVVGAFASDISGRTDQGAAYVFLRNGVIWNQQQQLTASDGVSGDYFGYSVSISGDYLVVGALFADISGNIEQGAAYVFNRSGVTWTQQQKLTANDGVAGDYFGWSVSISGDYLVVGAIFADILGKINQGAAYVFLRNGVTWNQQQKLTASDGTVVDTFGSSVSISGDSLVIGAGGADISGNANQGAAYVFMRNGNTWTQQQKLFANDGLTNDQFGNAAVSNTSGSLIFVVGGFFNFTQNAGAAYVFGNPITTTGEVTTGEQTTGEVTTGQQITGGVATGQQTSAAQTSSLQVSTSSSLIPLITGVVGGVVCLILLF